jgi:hypothetical protein
MSVLVGGGHTAVDKNVSAGERTRTREVDDRTRYCLPLGFIGPRVIAYGLASLYPCHRYAVLGWASHHLLRRVAASESHHAWESERR